MGKQRSGAFVYEVRYRNEDGDRLVGHYSSEEAAEQALEDHHTAAPFEAIYRIDRIRIVREADLDSRDRL